MITPRKVAFAGDWHMSLDWARTAIEHAAGHGANVLVHTGDFGYTYPHDFIDTVARTAARAELSILFIDGNEDDHRLLRGLPMQADGTRQLAWGVSYLPRGYRWEWGGLTFMALGGARSRERQWRHRDREPYWWDTEEITPTDAVAATAGGPVDIMITHDCPSGVIVPGLETATADLPDMTVLACGQHRNVLRRIVEAVQPKLLIHGHYHRYYHRRVDMAYGPLNVLGLDQAGSSLYRNIVTMSMPDLRTWATQ